MYARGGKNTVALVLFLLAGIVFGGLIGQYLGGFPYLDWLKYGQDFGVDEPLLLELGIIRLQFAIMIRFNVASVVGMLLSVLAYKKFL